jgi:hypothetical protein
MDELSRSAAAPLRSPAMERCVDPEVLDWYRLSPQERWTESMRLWDTFLLFGGRLDPEPDPQSPFYDPAERRNGSANHRQGLNSVRRGGV